MPTIDGQEVTEEFLKDLVYAVLCDDGGELHNPVPKMELIGSLRPKSLQEQIRRCMQIEINRRAMREGMETIEESMDFDVEDEDPEPISEYEYHPMKDEYPNAALHRKDTTNNESNEDNVDSENPVSGGSEGDNPESN